MKKISVILIFLLLVSFSSFGQANEDYGTTLKRMYELSGTEESYKSIVTQIFTLFKQQYTDVTPDVWDDLEKEFSKTSLNDLIEMLVPVYSKYMTQEDLQEIIKFYKTPVGKKFAKSTPLITQESMKIGEQWGMKIGQDFQKKIEEKGY